MGLNVASEKRKHNSTRSGSDLKGKLPGYRQDLLARLKGITMKNSQIAMLLFKINTSP